MKKILIVSLFAVAFNAFAIEYSAISQLTVNILNNENADSELERIEEYLKTEAANRAKRKCREASSTVCEHISTAIECIPDNSSYSREHSTTYNCTAIAVYQPVYR